MAEANLNREELLINDGLSSIVVVNALGDIPGGRTLDTTLLDDDVKVIKAGHIIVADENKKPYALGVSKGAYTELPEGWSYLGVLKASVLKKDARAAIVTIGQINAAASPYPVTAGIKAGLPRIEFLF